MKEPMKYIWEKAVAFKSARLLMWSDQLTEGNLTIDKRLCNQVGNRATDGPNSFFFQENRRIVH
jgi:hypothetical protein